MKQKILFSALFLFISIFIFAQETITVSGTIRDEKKAPLPGATVMVKGTAIGTTTDDAGKYTLQVPKDAKTIVVSYIGYDNREFPVKSGGNFTLDVNMSNSDVALNQVVVSVSKRKEKLIDAPASITVIGQDKLERNIVTTPVDQLKTSPGVDVMRTGLVSSNVVVRGFNNIFSGSVLNVIDNRIGSVPSLRVNAYQLVPVNSLDFDKIEVVRGPASALYGPNASSGVVSIQTKSPLEQERKFETTIAMTGGFTVLDKSYKGYNNGSVISGNIVNPEFRHSGKLWGGKFGYKISGSYFQGQDYPYIDPREPYTGDSILMGSVRYGETFKPDTIKRYTHIDTSGRTVLDSAKQDIRRFKKDFFIRKYSVDARIDIQPIKDITITINGGLASAHNIELTGLGAAQGGGLGPGWIYWYLQARFKWKNLFVQYFINSSDAGNTFLIPQLSASSRQSYNATSPPDPYQVQLLIDKSKIHVIQVQHSWSPVERLNFVYGVDVQLTRPNTQGTINGRFEDVDNLNQVGGYIQGDYEPLKWLKMVAAIRVDYNSIIKNVAASPRAAVVFKVADNQNVRLTYNRAFDSPNTLNQFLDLAQTQLPNGMNARGIGNPYGYNYNYASDGTIQFRTAPYTGAQNSGEWVSYGSTAANVRMFDSLNVLMARQFANTPAFSGNYPAALSIIQAIFDGIAGPNGTVANAKTIAVDLNKFGSTNDLPASIIANPTNIQNVKKINNEYTQTLELGYKGLLFKKLSLQVDAYWTRISNYVSPLTPASEAVMLEKSFLGAFDSTGQLYKNLYANNGLLNNLLKGALDGAASLQNPSITAPIHGSVWDELVVLASQLPIGAITPNSKYVNSDYILTFKNLGRLDVFGIDFGFQYNIYENMNNLVQAGGNLSWVDKDQLVLSTGESVPLNAPKVKAGVTYDYTYKKVGFGYGLTFRYQMGYYGNSSVYEGPVKPAYLLDARVSYRPSFYKGLLLSINVNNVTNYQWASFPGTPLMGTQFYAKAAITF